MAAPTSSNTMRSALLSAALVHAVAAEPPASPVACAIAATLFGTVFVIMLLYYLFNFSDPDIRRYSYETVSSTISIFAAVLLFQSFQSTLEYFLDGQPYWVRVVAAFLHRFFWLAILQLLLAFLTKTVGSSDDARKLILHGAKGGIDKKAMEAINLNTKCWGVILAHMTGFASINAWGMVQQTAWFRQNWYFSWLVVPCCIILNIPVMKFTECLRRKLAGADGADALEEKWNDEVAEGENDITALALSFLTIQSVKFAICGHLANVEGQTANDVTFNHRFSESIYLTIVGTMCIPVFCLFVIKLRRMEEEEEKMKEEGQMEEQKEAHEANEKKARTMDVLVASFVMLMAWCYYYSSKWALASMPFWQRGTDDDDTTLLVMVTAVVTSVIGFSFIFVLDKLADAEWTDDSADACIIATIQAIGIVVGFAWEQSFDAAGDALGSNTSSPVIAKQVLAIASVLLVVPAWKLYMLPTIVHEGWRFGFIASHATGHLEQYLQDDDKEGIQHYFEQLRFMVSGHDFHEQTTKHGHEYKLKAMEILGEELDKMKATETKYFGATETQYKPLAGK